MTIKNSIKSSQANDLQEWSRLFIDVLNREGNKKEARQRVALEFFSQGFNLSAESNLTTEEIVKIWSEVLKEKELRWPNRLDGDFLKRQSLFLVSSVKPFEKKLKSCQSDTDMTDVWNRFKKIQHEVVSHLYRGQKTESYFILTDENDIKMANMFGEPENKNKSRMSADTKQILEGRGYRFNLGERSGPLEITDVASINNSDIFKTWFTAKGVDRSRYIGEISGRLIEKYRFVGEISDESPYVLDDLNYGKYGVSRASVSKEMIATRDPKSTRFGVSFFSGLIFCSKIMNTGRVQNPTALRSWAQKTLLKEVKEVIKQETRSDVISDLLNLMAEVHPVLMLKLEPALNGILSKKADFNAVEWGDAASDAMWEKMRCFDTGVLPGYQEGWLANKSLRLVDAWLRDHKKCAILYTLFKDNKNNRGRWTEKFPALAEEIKEYVYDYPTSGLDTKNHKKVSLSRDWVGLSFEGATYSEDIFCPGSWKAEDWKVLINKWCSIRLEKDKQHFVRNKGELKPSDSPLLSLNETAHWMLFCIDNGDVDLLNLLANTNKSRFFENLIIDSKFGIFQQKGYKAKFEINRIDFVWREILSQDEWQNIALNALNMNFDEVNKRVDFPSEDVDKTIKAHINYHKISYPQHVSMITSKLEAMKLKKVTGFTNATPDHRKIL